MKNKRYILKNGIPIAEPDVKKWQDWMRTAQRLVRFTEIEVTAGNRFALKMTKIGAVISVKTVFLGIDHAFANEPPVLYETSITGGQFHYRRLWAHNITEAEKEHDFTVNIILQGSFACRIHQSLTVHHLHTM